MVWKGILWREREREIERRAQRGVPATERTRPDLRANLNGIDRECKESTRSALDTYTICHGRDAADSGYADIPLGWIRNWNAVHSLYDVLSFKI